MCPESPCTHSMLLAGLQVLPVEANLKGQESNLGKGLYLSLAKAVEEAEDGETVLLEPGQQHDERPLGPCEIIRCGGRS